MYILDRWVRMLAPFAPFTAEEIWEVLGNKTFVSLEKWPTPEKEKIDLKAELEENYLVKVIEDTREAIKATGLKPKLICYYVAPPWKMDVYAEVVSAKIKGVDPSKLIGELAKRYREKAKEVVKLVKNLVKDLGGLSEEELKIRASQSIDEYGVLTREKEFLSREFNAEIRVYWADDKDIYDPKGRAKLAVPWRPALYIEGEKIDR